MKPMKPLKLKELKEEIDKMVEDGKGDYVVFKYVAFGAASAETSVNVIEIDDINEEIWL